jgi:hypothetical protein
MFSTEWKRRWKKIIENDLLKILQRRILSQRLLILSIDIKKRKYVQIRLKNSDSFNFRSEISHQKKIDELMCSKIAFQKKKIMSEFYLLDHFYQNTRSNLMRKELTNNSHKKSFCTIGFLLFFSKSIFSVISIN